VYGPSKAPISVNGALSPHESSPHVSLLSAGAYDETYASVPSVPFAVSWQFDPSDQKSLFENENPTQAGADAHMSAHSSIDVVWRKPMELPMISAVSV